MNPASFPIGSPASRAAAREELETRLSRDLSEPTVFVWTGIPTPKVADGPLSAAPPDFIEYRKAADESIVQAVHRFWEAKGTSGVTIHINQVWPNGRLYLKEPYVQSATELKQLPIVNPKEIAEAVKHA